MSDIEKENLIKLKQLNQLKTILNVLNKTN